MSTVLENKSAIQKLTTGGKGRLFRRLAGALGEEWGKQIKADAAGRVKPSDETIDRS